MKMSVQSNSLANDNAVSNANELTLPSQTNVSMDDLVARIDGLERLVKTQAENAADTNALNMLVFDGSRDRLMAAFVMATGAAACGMQVSMFFTFWASSALRKGGPQVGKKTLVERAFGWMLPGSAAKTRLSQMDMGGIGRFLMEREMKRKNVSDLNQLIQTAAELGVEISVCEMSMQLMGIRREELIDYPNLGFCGVAQFVDQSAKANTTLFI